MSKVLDEHKTRFPKKLNEVYEVVQTVDLVTSLRRRVRVEVLKDYGNGAYVIKFWEILSVRAINAYANENGEPVEDAREFLSPFIISPISAPTPDAALSIALVDLTNY
ncbi:MAG: hypothetical protein ABSA18_11405 [Dehalococcoidia bacterium]|jgi:hypothetical protein